MCDSKQSVILAKELAVQFFLGANNSKSRGIQVWCESNWLRFHKEAKKLRITLDAHER